MLLLLFFNNSQLQVENYPKKVTTTIVAQIDSTYNEDFCKYIQKVAYQESRNIPTAFNKKENRLGLYQFHVDYLKKIGIYERVKKGDIKVQDSLMLAYTLATIKSLPKDTTLTFSEKIAAAHAFGVGSLNKNIKSYKGIMKIKHRLANLHLYTLNDKKLKTYLCNLPQK